MKSTLNLKQLREKIAEKSKLVGIVFAEAGDELDFSKVKSIEGDTTAKVKVLRDLNAELTDLKIDLDEMEALSKERKQADEMADYKGEEIKEQTGVSKKTIGELIMATGIAKEKGKEKFLDIDLKANFFLATTMGWPAESLRIPGFTGFPTRPVTVVDNIPTLPTTQNLVKYMKETVFTNTAAAKAEGAGGVEATLTLVESSDEVEKLTVYIPVSEEQLEDVPAAEGYLTNRLGFMIRQYLDQQVLEGTGASPLLLGTLSLAALQGQAKGADPTPDAIYKAFDLIRTVGFAEPSVLFINPADWQPIRLLRTADGIYIFGSPQDAGVDRIWGVPVVQTTAVTVNTALTGDYANFSTLYIRKGITVEMSSGYSTYFVEGKLAVKATMRAAMVHFRIPAFAKITGI